MPRKTTRMFVRSLKSIGIVDAGACEGAEILIAKRGAKMSAQRKAKMEAALSTLQEIMSEVMDQEGLDMAENKTEPFDVSKLDADAKAHVDKLTAQIATLETEVSTLKAQHTPEPTEDDVLKALPEAVRARFVEIEKWAQAAEDTAKAERDKRETAEFVEKAKAYRGLPIKAADFGGVLKRMHGNALTDTDRAEIERVLRAADEVLATKAFKAVGHDVSPEGATAIDRINAKAREMVEAGKAPTIEQAVSKVVAADKELAADYQRELRERS